MTHASSGLWRWGATLLGVLAIATIMGEARAQQQSISAWPMNNEVNESGTADSVSPPTAPNTTVIPWQPSTKPKTGKATDPNETQVTLVALLTQDGQRIESGLVWRVFKDKKDNTKPSEKDLVVTRREASPVLRLPPGDYYVNAAFGRAHLTRRITVKPGVQSVEPFVLNAGGLRVTALVNNGETAPPNSISYDVFSDERDQFGNPARILSGARPGVIVRLNSGIYHIVSTYGDANAQVSADVTVEAGKLTEANVTHSAAKVTFKLVTRAGGEALPDTHWKILDTGGEVVVESVGALPTHILAPGQYTATARFGGQVFRRDFSVSRGEVAEVEVVMR